jgi:cell wall-associated NlpC family hydrolase
VSEKSVATLAAALVIGVFAVLPCLAVVLGGRLGGTSDCATAGNLSAAPSSLDRPPPESRFDAEQVANAAAILQTGTELGVPDRGSIVAVTVAIQESDLGHLMSGDDGAMGLFQQDGRWGSVGDRGDPATSARLFFIGGRDGQPGLLDIPGWQAQPITALASAVRHRAAPGLNSAHVEEATRLVAVLRRATDPHVAAAESSHCQVICPTATTNHSGEQDVGRSTSTPAAPATFSPASSAARTTPLTATSGRMPAPPSAFASAANYSRATQDCLVDSTVAGGSQSAVATALAFARAQIGLPYEWGGNGPHLTELRSGKTVRTGGFDCSGLTKAAYAAAGINLPRTAQTQYNAGPRLDHQMPPQPGDLVFFGTGPAHVTHVGIVVAPGYMIDAPHTGTVIRLERIWTDVVGVTRPAVDMAPSIGGSR